MTKAEKFVEEIADIPCNDQDGWELGLTPTYTRKIIKKARRIRKKFKNNYDKTRGKL